MKCSHSILQTVWVCGRILWNACINKNASTETVIIPRHFLFVEWVWLSCENGWKKRSRPFSRSPHYPGSSNCHCKRSSLPYNCCVCFVNVGRLIKLFPYPVLKSMTITCHFLDTIKILSSAWVAKENKRSSEMNDIRGKKNKLNAKQKDQKLWPFVEWKWHGIKKQPEAKKCEWITTWGEQKNARHNNKNVCVAP